MARRGARSPGAAPAHALTRAVKPVARACALLYPSPMRRLLACLFVALTLAACRGSATPISYTPQPERIKYPAEELKKLILANTVSACVAEPDVSEEMLVVKYACAAVDGNSDTGNSVIRFGRVEAISVEKSGDWYLVRVRHKPGTEDFTWSSKILDDTERMADAISALTRPMSAPPPAAAAAR